MTTTFRTGIPLLFHCRRFCSETSVKAVVNPKSTERINGWVQKSHKCGSCTFLHISDGLSAKQVQVVVPKSLACSATVGSAISVSGRWQASAGSQQSEEFLAEKCDVLATDFEPRYTSLSPDQLRKKIHLRSRSPAFAALLRIRSKLLLKIHEYFMSRGYVHIDTPIITTNDCEGAGETFCISKASSSKSDDFFDKENVYLSVSGQLHLEAMVSGISQVYTISTGLRADKQQSRNHLTEFKMVEAELSFCSELADLLTVTEDFVLHLIRDLLSNRAIADDLLALGSYSPEGHLDILHRIAEGPPFPRVTYAEAINLLSTKKQKRTGGFSKQDEAFLVNYFNSPVFVTNFPSDQKPFYMLRSPDGNYTESFDLLCPVVGELAGGSIREPSLDALRERKTDIDWYSEIRERGKPISGGFGLGFERLLQFLLGTPNIKDTIPFPRWFKHCQC
ncbi:hypothetical protein Q1695_014354 [Nippostrongylus brasiliensis]|nr:hypothetical protein Q1695_014354 [Nippostrongylus brasiliensis]